MIILHCILLVWWMNCDVLKLLHLSYNKIILYHLAGKRANVHRLLSGFSSCFFLKWCSFFSFSLFIYLYFFPEYISWISSGWHFITRDYMLPFLQKQSAKKSKSSDLKYDIFGWIFLAVGLVALVGFAKINMPPSPPPR